MRFIREFREVGMGDVGSVGGKNASLGEMRSKLGGLGIRVPDGFAVTAEGYRHFLREAKLEDELRHTLVGVRKEDLLDLTERSERVRKLILGAALPADLEAEIQSAYRKLSLAFEEEATDVAVRSSATAEDLPTASFAGQQETFLDVRGGAAVVEAVQKAFASLFTPRAVSYRLDMGFDWRQVALSVGVQKMVRADLASAGVIFTLDPETGHRGFVLVTSSFGLGESIVQGRVSPDQFYVHKATLDNGFHPIVWKKLGTKETRLVYAAESGGQVHSEPVPEADRARWSLTDHEVLKLARWAIQIEEHYSRLRESPTPMDIEWAKDGRTGELFIVQARPETVHSQRQHPKTRLYTLEQHAEPVVSGLAVGDGIGTGAVRSVRDPKQLASFNKGEILVAEVTDPDWEPIMKAAAAIVTEKGGRTSHAAIVARELGIPAVVGATNAMTALSSGAMVTVSCAEGEIGRVYAGQLSFKVQEVDPAQMRHPHTRILLNVGHPEQAMKLSLLPSAGVGLARMEFIFAGWVGVHPLALTRYDKLPATTQKEVDRLTQGYPDKKSYFVDRLSQGIGTIAAAFWPREVILRFSDFKTNEYARLLGGAPFEPAEGNPMLGWRGASRYYHPDYKEGFLLEVAAVKRVRDEFGLTNLKVMVPFCRTPEEGGRVLEALAAGGLERGRNALEVYVMAEIPSNILLAEHFAQIFDGFSIGSNDLTQLTLGIDRDSTTVAPLFDERNEAIKWSCAHLIEVAHGAGRKVGICGQAPSDFPDFAAFLVERGIDSISVSPDALVRTLQRVSEAETLHPKPFRSGPSVSPASPSSARGRAPQSSSARDADDGDVCDDPS